MASLFVNGVELLSVGFRSGGIFVAATGVAGLVAQVSDAPPIFLALMSSLTVAGAARVLQADEPFDADYRSLRQVATPAASFLTALLALWGLGNVIPATANFTCQPLVPWHASIAVFGAFGMNWLAEAAKLRTSVPLGLMIHLAFFWIAPFYGFFHAPWFLAQSAALPCDGRPFAQVAVVGLAMAVAAFGGHWTARWMIR